MVVRAVFLSTMRCIVALVHLVVVRMVLLLFPAVAVDAAILEVAAIAVGLRFLLRAPELTLLLGRVLVNVRLPPIVLPVVGILALVSHVAPHLVIEGAPNRLEVEHVEVTVLLHLVEQVDSQLVFGVGKGAQAAEFALVDLVWPLLAEFLLVLLRVVEGLHTVVSLGTSIAERAFVGLRVLTHLRRVRAQGPSPVLLVIVEALFLIVPTLFLAWLRFEEPQVQQSHALFAAPAFVLLRRRTVRGRRRLNLMVLVLVRRVAAVLLFLALRFAVLRFAIFLLSPCSGAAGRQLKSCCAVLRPLRIQLLIWATISGI